MIDNSSWRPLPEYLTIAKSEIDGLGLFTNKDLPAGFDLGMSHLYDKRFQDNYIRLPLGAFLNHHEIPNCKAILSERDTQLGSVKHIRIITLQPIPSGSEITVKYIINKLNDPRWESVYERSQ